MVAKKISPTSKPTALKATSATATASTGKACTPLKSGRAAPAVNVDDLVVSRSNRERRPMEFFDSGNDAANSCAKDLDKPMVPAPPTPGKKRSPAATGAKPVQAANPSTSGAQPQRSKKRAPTPEPRRKVEGAAVSETRRPPRPEAQAVDPKTPRPVDQPANPIAPAPPKKAKKAKPQQQPREENAAAPTSRLLDYTDALQADAGRTAAPALAAASAASSPAPPARFVVTHFVDEFADRLGIGFQLAYADPLVAAAHLACGFLFRDGSCLTMDGTDTIAYVNRHRHRFTLRNVTGQFMVPTTLQKKFTALLFVRKLFREYNERQQQQQATHAASPATDGACGVAPAPPPRAPVHSALASWSIDEADCVSLAEPFAAVERDGPVYVLAANAEACPAGSPYVPRKFILSRRSAPYPGSTYYQSDDDNCAAA